MSHYPPNNLTDAFKACDPVSPLDVGDPRYVDLEYQNEDRWCDVQPAVLELPQFQVALTRLNEEDDRG
jgi:hypothetical protein